MKHLKKFNDDLNEGENYEKTKGGMLYVDLIEKYAQDGSDEEYRAKFEEYKPKIKGFTESVGELNIGDIIEITAGYNDDIRYTVEILGFDGDGDIYLLWDSFWAPIRNEARRAIKVIKKNAMNEAEKKKEKTIAEMSKDEKIAAYRKKITTERAKPAPDQAKIEEFKKKIKDVGEKEARKKETEKKKAQKK